MKDELAKIRILRTLYIKHLKRFDGKLRIYLTMGCNLNCPYCVNQFFKGSNENKINNFKITKDYEKWTKAINREKRDVIFTGGEPTLYPRLIDLLNAIDESIKVQIDTNLVWGEDFLNRFIHELKPQVRLYASFHPVAGDPQKVIEIIKELKKHNKFKGYVHIVNAGLSKNYLKKTRDVFKKNKIHLMVDDNQYDFFEGCSRNFRKKVICYKKVFLIAPDGRRYPCLSYLVRQKGGLENFFEEKLSNSISITRCGDYGFCAPCDGLGEMRVKNIN